MNWVAYIFFNLVTTLLTLYQSGVHPLFLILLPLLLQSGSLWYSLSENQLSVNRSDHFVGAVIETAWSTSMACRLPPRNPVSFPGFCPVRQNGKAEDCGPLYTAGSIPTLARAAPKPTRLGLMHQGANREANVAPSNYFANNRSVTKCWRQPLPLAAPPRPP